MEPITGLNRSPIGMHHTPIGPEKPGTPDRALLNGTYMIMIASPLLPVISRRPSPHLLEDCYRDILNIAVIQCLIRFLPVPFLRSLLLCERRCFLLIVYSSPCTGPSTHSGLSTLSFRVSYNPNASLTFHLPVPFAVSRTSPSSTALSRRVHPSSSPQAQFHLGQFFVESQRALRFPGGKFMNLAT